MIHIRRSSTHRRLLGALVVVGAVLAGALATPLSAQAVVPIPTAVAQILADTNALRAAGGLAPLTESVELDRVAQNWSSQMFANGALTHNPSYSTQIPSGWTRAAENIASGYSYTSVVEAWHQSPGHYQNIMGDYNTIGIGYFESGGQTYFTQDFGKYATIPSPAPSSFGNSSAVSASGSVAVYRFWSPQNKTHFFTASAQERDSIIATYPAQMWTYEGIGFRAFTSQTAGTVPLYRFFSSTMSGHFYTASSAEKDSLIATYPTNVWNYEGIAFYVYPAGSSAPGSIAVSRFWSPTDHQHFYTSSVDEKNQIIATYPTVQWTYEGDDFRVPAS